MPITPLGGPSAIDRAAQTGSSRRPADATGGSDREKLKKACHEMEGYFVGMLLKQMHQSAMKGGFIEEKSESATYRDMFDDAVAAEIGKQGSFGIADMLYRNLSRELEIGAGAISVPATSETGAALPAPSVLAVPADERNRR